LLTYVRWLLAPSAQLVVDNSPVTAPQTGAAGGGKFCDWPIQMAGNTWINMDAFCEALRKALEVHMGKYKGEVDQAFLEESFRRHSGAVSSFSMMRVP
jgi:hypothetical protein